MTLETQIKNKETESIIKSITAQSNENSRDIFPYLRHQQRAQFHSWILL